MFRAGELPQRRGSGFGGAGTGMRCACPPQQDDRLGEVAAERRPRTDSRSHASGVGEVGNRIMLATGVAQTPFETERLPRQDLGILP